MLRIRSILGYAAAESGIVGAEVMIQLYLLKFYTAEIGLRADLAGYALAIAVLWDMVADVIVGRMSDNSRSALGRRRPYILAGGLLLGFALPVLFFPPGFESQAGKFLYLLLSYMLVNTAMAVLSVPHAALGSELTQDPSRRTLVVGLRLLCGNVGLLLGTLLPGIFLIANPLPALPAKTSAAFVAAAVAALSAFLTFIAAKGMERMPEAGAANQGGLLADLWSVRLNRPFVVLFAALLVATIGRTINSSAALFYYDRRLGISEQDVVIYVLGVFILVITFSVPFWVWLASRIGKIRAAFSGILGLGLMTSIAYPLFPASDLRGPMFAAVFGGIAVGSIVLLDSLLADIVDLDELRTGKNREGLYFGVWKMGSKVSRAAGLAFSGIALSAAGAETEKTDVAFGMVGFNLAVLFGPVVGVFFIAAAMMFVFLRYGPEIHARVQSLLQRRKARRAQAG